MKKTLLSVALLASITAAQAQREVGSAQRVDFQFPAERGTDTLFLSSFGTGLAIYHDAEVGYITGTNSYGDKAMAQEFVLDGPVTVDEVLFLLVKNVGTGGAGSQIRAVIWDMDGTDGVPMTELGTSAMVSIDDADTTGLMGFSVGSVMTDGNFAAGIELTGLATNDSLGIISTQDGNSVGPDRVWVLEMSDAWSTLTALWDIDVDLVVAPVLTADWVGVGEGSWVNGMRMSIIGGNPATANTTIRFENQNDADMSIHIFDAAGRTVVLENMGNRPAGLHDHELNTSTWNAGVYYVTLRANGQPMTLKLVKE